MSAGLVLIAAPVHPVLTDGLVAEGYEIREAVSVSQAEAALILQDCTGVVTSTRLMLDRDLMESAPLLRWIGRMGSGMEVIDLDQAALRGITCFSSPEGNCNAVAEHALGLLLGLTKKIVSSAKEVSQGIWLREENRGLELEGRTIGIIGYGHTGRAFAKKLAGFDVRVLAYDKYQEVSGPGYVTACSSLEPIYEQAEVVSFHVPLQQDTVDYFNQSFHERMQKNYILLNTSRGKVVDLEAVFSALKGGKLMGAGLDVLPAEPLSALNGAEKRLVKDMLAMPQVILTPHTAGYSREALYKMSKALLGKIVTLR